MTEPDDWRDGRGTAGWGDVARDDLLARSISVSPRRPDFGVLDGHVGDLLAFLRPRDFRALWGPLARQLELGDQGVRARREARALAELSWFCRRGPDPSFRVWDGPRLRRHVARLAALRLGVPEHEATGVDLVWEALHWTAEDLGRWERLQAATGRAQGPAAVAAALEGLVRLRCRGWPEVDAGPAGSGPYHLTSPRGDEITIDLSRHHSDRAGRSWYTCTGRYQSGAEPPDEGGFDREWSDPRLLASLTEFLRDAGLGPRPEDWPVLLAR